MLEKLPPKWKCLFATAIYTGMRKGELLALRKVDVDLSARLITIRRSHDRDATKGNHADAIPIATELVPYLRARFRRPRRAARGSSPRDDPGPHDGVRRLRRHHVRQAED